MCAGVGKLQANINLCLPDTFMCLAGGFSFLRRIFRRQQNACQCLAKPQVLLSAINAHTFPRRPPGQWGVGRGTWSGLSVCRCKGAYF